MAETVGVNYQWPADLHAALKALAEKDGVSLRDELLEAVAYWLHVRAT